MNLKKALNRRTVCLHLHGATKQEIIEEMVGLLDKAGLLRNRDAALACVLEREQQMSTGMQYGVAIPHGRTDTTDTLLAAVGIHPHGVDFDSIDHEPSRLFILTVSPAKRSGPQLQFLAEVSRLLTNADVRARLLEAASEDEVIALLTA
jgi:PTS system nitrogen regulatory IIA component